MKELTLRISKIGTKAVDKNEEYLAKFQNVDRRLGIAEDQFEDIVEKLMEAPPGINLSGLKILGGGGSELTAPTPSVMAPSSDSGMPTLPAMSTPAAGPTPAAAPALAGGPSLEGGPAPAAAPAPAGGPSLEGGPAPASTPAPAGGPNLAAGPSLSAGPQNDGIAGGLANLKAAPVSAPSGGPGGPSGGGGEMSAGGIQSALSGLKKAPQQEEDPVTQGGSGSLGFNPAAALAGLKKAPQKEEEAPSGGGSTFGFDPKAALAGLKKAPKKGEDEEPSESKKSEFASLLDKRRKETEEKETQLPEEKADSAEDMKTQLQARLKAAFKK